MPVFFLSHFPCSHLESVTFSLPPRCLYYRLSPNYHLYSPSPCLPTLSLSFTLIVPFFIGSVQLAVNRAVLHTADANFFFFWWRIASAYDLLHLSDAFKMCLVSVHRTAMNMCRYANESRYVNECPNLDVNFFRLLIIIRLMRHKVGECKEKGALRQDDVCAVKREVFRFIAPCSTSWASAPTPTTSCGVLWSERFRT